MAETDYIAAEQLARRDIDAQLADCGWTLQDASAVNLAAGRGVAIREFGLIADHGRADYLLYVDGQAVGAIEAKPAGTPLAGVFPQLEKYLTGLPDEYPAALRPLPFGYVSTGVETLHLNKLDPEPMPRQVFTFHRPETLADWIRDATFRHPDHPSLRARLTAIPPLRPDGLWPAQEKAIRNLEKSLALNRPRALIQMATGSGKTFTAANFVYRLTKHADAKRVLFLVDRSNLGRQTLKEFQAFTVPDGSRKKFTELYNVQHLSGQTLDQVARVTISTVQRLYSILRSDPEMDQELDEHSLFDLEPEQPVEVDYNPNLPIEAFDFIVIDECHRSIYGVWRQVLEYFDAFLIGLTATPGKQTFGFFNRNLIMEYDHARAVADSVNVDFDVYRISTQITEQGSTVDAGLVAGFKDKETRDVRWEKLDEPVTYEAKALDHHVVAKDQIRTVLTTFRDRLFTEIFPKRTEVPKTLIFAKDDAHADEIVQMLWEVFGKGPDFAAKITYRTTGAKPEDLLQAFRNSYNPRIVVTVDMIATGTDVRPLECVFFMRSVKSRTFFEQMKGRGVRIIDPDDLRAVTPDAKGKSHFVIVDAVGVTESDLVDTQPLDRKKAVGFDKLLNQVAFGSTDPAVLSSIAGRLARLDNKISAEERTRLEGAAGQSLQSIKANLVEALDPDRQLDHAIQLTGNPDPTDEQIEAAANELLRAAASPIAANPEFRQLLVDFRRRIETLVDVTSGDVVTRAEASRDATHRAQNLVASFRDYIEEHKDEITALQFFYNVPHRVRLTFGDIKELASAISKPPRNWTPEALWEAYETLDHSRVHGSGRRMLTDLVSLVRYTLEQEDELIPFQEIAEERFAGWLLSQHQAGREFTPDQHRWLGMIKDHIAASLEMTIDDFDYVPFVEHGGLGRAHGLFGDSLGSIIDELREVLAA